jgi:UDP-glucose 4-epimerase
LNFLITGGSGFFGSILQKRLLDDGHTCVNIDLEKDEMKHKNLTSVVGDIRDAETVEKVFQDYGPFDACFHIAAQLAHAVKEKEFLWESNVNGTENIAQACIKNGVKKLVFTSSNCLWGDPMGRPVLETDKPDPVEIYGRSKVEGEKILLNYKEKLDSIIIRCPTIIAAGRLGLLAILYEFMEEGRKVWVVGGGKNKYQFIYADDLVNACIKALDVQKTEIFNIGSDHVQSFREIYEYVIQKAESKSRVANLPRSITIPAMKIFYKMGISPLGPYQYKMIAEDFEFDTSKIKKELDWKPTKTNADMLLEAYEYYKKNRKEIECRKDVSAHKQSAKMGVIRLLKWLS